MDKNNVKNSVILVLLLVITGMVYWGISHIKSPLEALRIENKKLKGENEAAKERNAVLKDTIIKINKEIENLNLKINETANKYNQRVARILQQKRDFDLLLSDNERDSVLRSYIRSNQQPYRSR